MDIQMTQKLCELILTLLPPQMSIIITSTQAKRVEEILHKQFARVHALKCYFSLLINIIITFTIFMNTSY